ncbi:MAG: hypothetical protein U9P80_02275 [Thermodesulfobacteriota bacterium]|nr:hypothetical protein [Thermodesulfobacteriota bacterium]
MEENNLIDFMMTPGAYPEDPGHIDLVQTHISWVFIGQTYVYKVKKPVDFGFLNFSDLEKRGFYVNEELRLNQRFSPDIYIKVIPISSRDGKFYLDDNSNIVEYALKMKRISEDHMLYRLLEKGQIQEKDMDRIAVHLARVYKEIPSDEKARDVGTFEAIKGNVVENFDQTRKYISGPISRQAFERIEAWSIGFMDKNAGVFKERLENGFIKDCHGDLHLQHICMEKDEIYIFDCIEFNERFRFADVAADIAFLAMDLDYNGHKGLSINFVDSYIEASKDSTMHEVLTFYKVYRAYVRAKITSFMLDDKGLDSKTKESAIETARKYYDLALEYVEEEA